MGKQVGFYMSMSDEDDFMRFLRSDRNIGIFIDPIPTQKIPLLEELPTEETLGGSLLWLWDQDHSPAPTLKYSSEQRYYLLDFFASEVIQFLRCNLDEGRLVRGRIWAEMNYWRYDDPPTLIEKGTEFRKWYNRLASWIKRHSVRDKYGDYVMPGAAEFQQQGGRLVQAVFAKHVKIFHHKSDDE
jgi:hypothetical protein